MSNWSPKPRRPADPNPLFKQVEDETYVVKGLTPLQRQRREDGTPYTVGGRTCLGPEEHFYLSEDKIDKSQPAPQAASKLDPDAIVKSFLEKGMPDKDSEDEEKGMGVGEAARAVGNTAVGAGKQLITAATNTK